MCLSFFPSKSNVSALQNEFQHQQDVFQVVAVFAETSDVQLLHAEVSQEVKVFRNVGHQNGFDDNFSDVFEFLVPEAA